METESLRLLRNREVILDKMIAETRARLADLERERSQVREGIRAMTGAIEPTGKQASRDSVAYFAKQNNPEMQFWTMKQLVVLALSDHLKSGATANDLLDFFAMKWGRNDIMRTSLSPQLSRLKQDGVVERRGKVWRLVRNENEPPPDDPEDGSETALVAQSTEATE